MKVDVLNDAIREDLTNQLVQVNNRVAQLEGLVEHLCLESDKHYNAMESETSARNRVEREMFLAVAGLANPNHRQVVLDEARRAVGILWDNIGEDAVGGILEQMELLMEDRVVPRMPSNEGRLVPIEDVLNDPLPEQIQLEDDDEDGDTNVEGEGPQVEVAVLECRVYPLSDRQQEVRNIVAGYLGNPLPTYRPDPPPEYVGGWGADAEVAPEIREEWRRQQEAQDAQQQVIDEEERAIDELSEPGQDHPPDEVVEDWSRVRGSF